MRSVRSYRHIVRDVPPSPASTGFCRDGVCPAQFVSVATETRQHPQIVLLPMGQRTATTSLLGPRLLFVHGRIRNPSTRLVRQRCLKRPRLPLFISGPLVSEESRRAYRCSRRRPVDALDDRIQGRVEHNTVRSDVSRSNIVHGRSEPPAAFKPSAPELTWGIQAYPTRLI